MKHNFFYKDGDIELRPMTYEDSEKYRLLRNQEQNRIRFFFNGQISHDSQLAWFEKYLSDETDIMFSFYYKGAFAGGNAIYHLNRQEGTGEYGRLLVDKIHFPMKGLGSAITYAASCIAYEKLGLSKIYSEIYEDNLPSMYACLKAGFKEIETRTLNDGQTVFYIENTFSGFRKDI